MEGRQVMDNQAHITQDRQVLLSRADVRIVNNKGN
jgi:hypothetical protein